jgi:hypothetical protein
MNSAKKLFDRYDPLEKAEDLFIQPHPDADDRIISIRPVWIIGDLIPIYEWINGDLGKTNWNLNQNNMGVMQHYEQILLSEYAQSFMIEQNNKPALQIDLLPLQMANFPGKIEFNRMDYAIHYLYRESFRDPDLFKRCLTCMIGFIFTHPDLRLLYLRLTKPEPAFRQLLFDIGFESVDVNSFFGKSLNIYKIRRSGVHF